MTDDTATIQRIEKDRRHREALLLSLLLAYSDKAQLQARSAIRVGADPVTAATQAITGNSGGSRHVHWPGLFDRLLPVLAETYAAGYVRAADIADVEADAADVANSPAVRQAARDLASKTSDAVSRIVTGVVATGQQQGLNSTKTARLIGDAFKATGMDRDNPFAADAAAERAVVTNYGGGMFEAWQVKATDKVTGFRHVSTLDDRTTVICIERAGLMLPASDPYWKTNWPSLHWRCRSMILPIFGKFTPSMGYPLSQPMPGFGVAPPIAFGAFVGRAA